MITVTMCCLLTDEYTTAYVQHWHSKCDVLEGIHNWERKTLQW